MRPTDTVGELPLPLSGERGKARNAGFGSWSVPKPIDEAVKINCQPPAEMRLG